MVSIMPNKEIKLKLTLNSIVEYDGGAEVFLNDIKNAGVIIHRDDEGFLMTSDCVGKYSAYTESVSNLNELDHLVIHDMNDNEIGKLKIDFLELDDSLYNIPEGSTFEETELIIGFLEPETYTILFTNLTHPEFDIALPEPRTVVEGESVTLPSVSGEYEDTEYIYTPESWNIGAFESEITPTEDMTANLVWHSEAKIIEHTITFTNTTHPEFEVEFPESITVEDGESVSLPSVSGSFEDSGYEYTPLEWSIGAFGESFTPTEDVTANLLWKAEEIKPALPEVSSRNDFGDYNWLYVNTNLSYKTIQPNADEQLVFSISKSPAPYDSSKSYGVMIMQQYENGASGDSTLFSIINYSDTIGVKNISSNAVDAYAFRIAICSSSQAIIVIVYSSNNTAYNAFKYTLDGVDYYYVLDNIQTDWVNDLSSIGYSLTKHMPRVFELLPKSPAVSFGGYNTVVEATDIDGNQIPYSDVEDSMTFNNTSVICICFNNYTYGFVNAGEQVTSFFTNSNGYVAWKSSRYYQNDYCKFASFVSYPNNVTIVDVYQKEAPYRCCKAYYCDGQYFVIDRIQKEWVSDLNSIGYQLNEIENIAYLFGKFYLDGASVSYSQSMSIHVDSNDGLLYTCVGAYNSSGTDYKDRVTLNRNDKWISIYMSLSGNSNLNLYSIKYSTQSRMPKVVSPYMAQFGSSAQTISIQPNAISPWLYITYSSSNINKNDYSGFINGVVNLTDSSNNVVARTGLSAVWDNTNGGQGTYSGYNLAIRNDTGSDVSCMYSRVKLCQNNLIDVTVVTVYDSSNVAYNSFKYTTNGTDYYYVLDDIQSDWVTDLSSIGYSLTKNLPTVQNVQCWLAENKGSTGMSPPSFTTRVFDENNNRIPYSSDLLYCVFLVSSYPSADGEFYVVNSTNTTIAIHRENGTGYIDIYSVFYASCSDKTAIIIDVYDSQNNVFKAFKYTLDGVDYYRVMEWQNTHPDWVSDLSSIGYSLSKNLPIISELTLYTTNETHSWQFGVTNATQTVDSRYVYDLYTDDTCTTLFNGYDATKLYLKGYIINNVWKKSNIQSILDMPSETTSSVVDAVSATILQTNSKVWFVSNYDSTTTDGSYQHVLVFKVCSSNEAEVITVYNSNNEEFSAFKYVKDGTDYYYVLDGVQNEWTEDLSSIGYSLIKTLPTVSMSGEFGENNMLACASGQNPRGSFVYIFANSTEQPYIYGTDRRPVYDVNKTYATVYAVDDEDNRIDATIVGYVNDGSSNLLVKNLGNNTILYNSSKVAACSSNESEVVTVYNLSNEAFNAFKYNLDGTDYYYILDDIQTEWTDNLDKIGYSLIQFSEKTLYFHYKGSEMTILREQVYSLYDGINTFTYMPFSSLYGKKSMKPSSGYGFLVDSNGKMGFTYRGGDPSQNVTSVTIAPLFKVYFTTQGSSATDDFTFHGGTITNVYDSTGNTIPYDSSKTYIKYAVYNIDGQIVSNDLTNSMKFINNGGYLAVVREWMTYDSTTSIFMVEYFE